MITIGGHNYVTSPGFSVQTYDDPGPYELANAETIQTVLGEMHEDHEEEYEIVELPLCRYGWERFIKSKNAQELRDVVETPYHRGPAEDDAAPFLSDKPPVVVVDDADGSVYVLEDSETPMAELLAAFDSGYVLDESRASEIEQEMMEEQWDEWGFSEVTGALYWLNDFIASIPAIWDVEGSFTDWYHETCGLVGRYPHMEGGTTCFPAVCGEGRYRRWEHLDSEEEAQSWADEYAWEAIGGKTDELAEIVALLSMFTQEPPRILIAEHLASASRDLEGAPYRPWRELVDIPEEGKDEARRKVLECRRMNAAALARQRLLEGKEPA